MKQRRRFRAWPLAAALAAIVGLIAAATMARADDRKEGASYLLFTLRWAAEHHDAEQETAKIDSPFGPAAAQLPVNGRDAAEQTADKPESVTTKESVDDRKSGGDLPPDVTRFDGKPYKLYPDGKVNFATYRGYNMYASVCHVCHGHAGLGSSFAPSLVDSLKTMSYEDFVTVVMNGRQDITSATTDVMPPFGDNPSVSKYIDSIYAYLKARSDGAIGDSDVEWQGPKDE